MVKIIICTRFFLLSAKNDALVILYWKDFSLRRLLFDIKAKPEWSFVFSSPFLVNFVTGSTPHLSTYKSEFLHKVFFRTINKAHYLFLRNFTIEAFSGHLIFSLYYNLSKFFKSARRLQNIDGKFVFFYSQLL